MAMSRCKHGREVTSRDYQPAVFTLRPLIRFSPNLPIPRRPQNEDTLVYDKTDVREGGCDVFHCGPPNDLRFRGETTYQVIVAEQVRYFH
jgi:hypothetical protein